MAPAIENNFVRVPKITIGADSEGTIPQYIMHIVDVVSYSTRYICFFTTIHLLVLVNQVKFRIKKVRKKYTAVCMPSLDLPIAYFLMFFIFEASSSPLGNSSQTDVNLAPAKPTAQVVESALASGSEASGPPSAADWEAFHALDLRVGRIVGCEKHPDAER